MFNYKMKTIHIICSFLFIISLSFLSGCGDKNTEDIDVNITESNTDMTQSTIITSEQPNANYNSVNNSNNNETKSPGTESKSWKEAYIDYIYEIESQYKECLIGYNPTGDFSGDGIDDFIIDIYKDNELVKDIAVVYYNGGVATFESKKGIGSIDITNKYLCELDDSDSNVPYEELRIEYIKFVDGKFIVDKVDHPSKGSWGQWESIVGYGQYDMISAIQKGNNNHIYV